MSAGLSIRRRALVGGAVLAGLAGRATAQAKPLVIVDPYPPGGGHGRLARLIAPGLGQALGQTIVVENRAGAGGTIGVGSVARAPANGQTLLVAAVADIAVAPVLYKTTYDTLTDLVPITMIAQYQLVMAVGARSPYKSVADFVAAAKARPGKLTFASPSAGSLGHISAELLKHIAGIDVLHVPYKGSAPAVTDLVGGHVDMLMGDAGTLKPLIESDRLRALAVTGSARARALPALPTLQEAGIRGHEMTGWWGLFAPRGTSAATVESLYRECARIILSADVRAQIEATGPDAVPMAPAKFQETIRADVELLRRVVRQVDIRIE